MAARARDVWIRSREIISMHLWNGRCYIIYSVDRVDASSDSIVTILKQAGVEVFLTKTYQFFEIKLYLDAKY